MSSIKTSSMLWSVYFILNPIGNLAMRLYRWFVRLSCAYFIILMAQELLLHLFLADSYKIQLFLINIPIIYYAYAVNSGIEEDRKWLAGFILFKALFPLFIIYQIFKDLPSADPDMDIDVISILRNAMIAAYTPQFIAGILGVTLLLSGKQYRRCFIHERLLAIDIDDDN